MDSESLLFYPCFLFNSISTLLLSLLSFTLCCFFIYCIYAVVEDAPKSATGALDDGGGDAARMQECTADADDMCKMELVAEVEDKGKQSLEALERGKVSSEKETKENTAKKELEGSSSEKV